MTTVFEEPEWEEDSIEMATLFVHKTPGSVTAKKKIKKAQPNESDWPHEVGKYVRIRCKSDDKLSEEVKQQPELQKLSKKQRKNKRKLEEQTHKTEFQPKKQKLEVKSVPIIKHNFSDKLRENLKGSRFRFINEQLYKSGSCDAVKLFQKDVEAFQAYHEGYRVQVEGWPSNPLKRMINAISKCPKTEIIADFGCGEGELAKSVSHKVYSLDLVAINDNIIACDMADTPLKSESVNIAVFCLSLMGTNLKDFIIEANRVLTMGGKLKIAEVESRFGSNTSVNDFIKNIEKCGFELLNKDLNTKLFYFFNFKKIKRVDKNLNVKNFSLKPCLYKKR